MPKIAYKYTKFNESSQTIIAIAIDIIDEYQAAGYSLTLRQLYYQFVARGHIANKDSEYKRLGKVINNARMAGLIDWSAIEDRTRNVRRTSMWGSPGSIMQSVVDSYQENPWDEQETHVEVWIEKDALIGVIERVCDKWRVPYYSCRGYSSQSEMWGAAQRFIEYNDVGKDVVIIHLGDHDPSGLDMTRDIYDRLHTFGADKKVDRVALNMDQITDELPPNPAKLSDSRASVYVSEFGYESWELDALKPDFIVGLIDEKIRGVVDDEAWQRSMRAEAANKDLLVEFANGLGS